MNKSLNKSKIKNYAPKIKRTIRPIRIKNVTSK